MFPYFLLQKMSAHACKTYLILRAELEMTPRQVPAIVTLPMEKLVALQGISPRICPRALRELARLKLIRVLPFRYHKARSYALLPYPDPSPADAPSPAPKTVRTPVSGHIPPTPPTPPAAPKTQARTPVSALLNHFSSPTARTPMSGCPTDESLDPAALRLFAEHLPPDERSQFLTSITELEGVLQLRDRVQLLRTELARRRTQPARPNS